MRLASVPLSERFYLLKYSGVDPFKNGFITINHTYIMYAKRYDFYQNSGIFFEKFFDFFAVEWMGGASHFGASATLSNR